MSPLSSANATDDTAADVLSVRHGDDVHEVATDRAFTFGRRADLVLDADNRALHRRAGRLAVVGGHWTLENCGRSIALILSDLDSPSHATLAPGRGMPLPYANASLTLAAGHALYRLSLHQPNERVARVREDIGVDGESDTTTRTVTGLVFNDEQRRLLERLAAPRRRGPITSADLPNNRAIAEALGWSMPKLNRKLDHLCLKFDRAGLPGVVPSGRGSASNRRLVIANFVVECGLLDTEAPPGSRLPDD